MENQPTTPSQFDPIRSDTSASISMSTPASSSALTPASASPTTSISSTSSSGVLLPPPLPPLPLPTRQPTPKLPAECLQLIMAHFEDDLTMLHSLLLVNSIFFQLAVRLLYRSPFRLLKAFDGDKLPWDKYRRQVKLVWLLLSCVMHHPWVSSELPPMDTSFPVLRNPARHHRDDYQQQQHYQQQQQQQQYLPGLDNERCTLADPSPNDSIIYTTNSNNNVSHDERTATTRRLDDNDNSDDGYKDLTIDYLRFYIHHDHPQLSDAFPDLFPGLICRMMDEWRRSEDMIRLRHTIERAFLLHHPETIVSLTIPLSRIETYLESGAVTRLSRLKKIEFVDIKNWNLVNIQQATLFLKQHDRARIQENGGRNINRNRSRGENRSGHMPQTRKEGDCRQQSQPGNYDLDDDGGGSGGGGRAENGNGCGAYAESQIDLSEQKKKKRKEKFAVTLTEIKLGGTDDSGIIQTLELYRIPQALRCLRALDVTGWRGAALDMMSIPTESLQVLKMRLDRPLPIVSPLLTFLAHARQLKELQICIARTHEGCFGPQLTEERNYIQKMKRLKKAARLERLRQYQQQQQRHRRISNHGREADNTEDKETRDNMDGSEEDENEDEDPERNEDQGLEVLSLSGETRVVVHASCDAARRYCRSLITLQVNSWKESTGLQFEDIAVGPVIPQMADGGDDDEGNPFPPPPPLPLLPPPLPVIPATATGNNGHSDSDDDSDSDSDNNNSTIGTGYTSTSIRTRSRLSLQFEETMICLRSLELRGEIAALHFVLESLKRCPTLQTLKLNTKPSKIEPASSTINALVENVSTELNELELVGPWWITDSHLNRIANRLLKMRSLRLIHASSFYSINAQSPATVTHHHGSSASKAISLLPSLLPSPSPSSSKPVPSPSLPCSDNNESALSNKFLSPTGILHAVQQMGQLQEIQLGMDMDRFRRLDQERSLPFIAFRKSQNNESKDIWTLVREMLEQESLNCQRASAGWCPFRVEVQHCPT
ncbi:hypothetical protein BX616_010559 [Lobosporangium transversale]|uniref:Uncharacterized protein n=1 Tax=Lobosporangium transversale TaxID=64571 RepID=A0A1Y2GX49_9FUNG|nr:hypothetical protein BCR41DRAFT_346987 [Lobosporangium transversale]KAF9911604.1 hypothetical protein BX616_010559 [Lobosporangium transversale]ORZ26859.1 hypothetical protein BCR41DRAFT_346987 [Lobosporangium transversale]|eukprot:XP_021884606.1 hypothetical protein BCR41DRAFT_346987 [Lobosporangium transversale]